ncbi:rab-GTPase-TBC domain-containing protein [Globomyces pollinis-pini]|nr:rab-GTPase-TBC domain-containing protein [Globomyces pollinis-pini]
MFGVYDLSLMRSTTDLHLNALRFYSGNNNQSSDFPSLARILGRYKTLDTILNSLPPFLACQIDFHKSKNSHCIIFSSHHPTLQSRLNEFSPLSLDQLKKWALDLITALDFLHSKGIVLRNIGLENILIDKNNDVLFTNHILYYITGNGTDVDFPIGNPKYFPPELISGGTKANVHSTTKTDMWSLGVLLLEIYLTGNGLIDSVDWFKASDIVSILKNTSSLTDIIQALELDVDFKSVLLQLLDIDPKKRPSAATLFNSKFLEGFKPINGWQKRPFIPAKVKTPTLKEYNPSMYELYNLWKLNGADLDKDVFPQVDTTVAPAIDCLPKTVMLSTSLQASILALQKPPLYQDEISTVSLQSIWEKINVAKNDPNFSQTTKAVYNDSWKQNQEFTPENFDSIWRTFEYKPGQMNFSVKDKDVNYQILRLYEFKQLLKQFPHSREMIRKEALYDVPPLLRGAIWAAILDIRGDPELLYNLHNIEKEMQTDRQLDLDIPRCHQYHELLSNPLGHKKLKRVLKAWIASEKGKQVYWQGLDSLCACFVTLNFNNEALAFASMKAFINKYCKGFFILDNSKVMREHMLTFRHLHSFHDPELAHHLHSIGLGPEFYAISWFMTLFAHVFPLDKIYYLWDHLLTGPEYLYMYMAVAILYQLRDEILKCDFTNAMLLFSDLAEVNVETCLMYAIRISKITPPSIINRMKDSIDSILKNQENESNNRFSFMSAKTSIITTLSVSDYMVIKTACLIIDTRRPELLKAGHIRGSICVDTDAFAEESDNNISQGLKLLLQRNRYVVLISEGEQNDVTHFINVILVWNAFIKTKPIKGWSH